MSKLGGNFLVERKRFDGDLFVRFNEIQLLENEILLKF